MPLPGSSVTGTGGSDWGGPEPNPSELQRCPMAGQVRALSRRRRTVMNEGGREHSRDRSGPTIRPDPSMSSTRRSVSSRAYELSAVRLAPLSVSRRLASWLPEWSKHGSPVTRRRRRWSVGFIDLGLLVSWFAERESLAEDLNRSVESVQDASVKEATLAPAAGAGSID